MMVKKSFRGIPIPFMCMLINFRPLSIFVLNESCQSHAIILREETAWA
uniref:Uncharacterized protein n=1 Tax=Populus trichocarpa TaxID=3694 RepID=A0A3N7FF21_POPTR